MTDSDYLTVGDLARRVGVTVRTIQYYDQQGLLSPLAKGPQNQRLYSSASVKDLYRILTLKYLGLSLTEIKSDAALYRGVEAVKNLADQQMDAIEEEFQALFKRMAALRALRDETQKTSQADWESMALAIERCQDESRFFWRLICIRDDASMEEEEEHELRDKVVSKWHELIADTIRQLPLSEPLDSQRNRDLAMRRLALEGSEDLSRTEDHFILMEGMAAHPHGDGSFDMLRQTVFHHLEAVVAAYKGTLPSEDARVN